jgi:hypothetical protein
MKFKLIKRIYFFLMSDCKYNFVFDGFMNLYNLCNSNNDRCGFNNGDHIK